MNHQVSWWIKGGSDLRTETGTDIINYDGDLSTNEAEQILEASLSDFSTTFANEHYLIECGVWDFGVCRVQTLEKANRIRDRVNLKEKEYWDGLWDKAKYMQKTGMPLSYLKREKICPDCGGEIWSGRTRAGHLYYHCDDCSALFANKGSGHYMKCREW